MAKTTKLLENSQSKTLTNKGRCVEDWKDFTDKFQPFQYFITLTFNPRGPSLKNQWLHRGLSDPKIHIDQAYKQFHKFIRQINEQSYGKRYRNKGRGVHYVACHEYQKRGVSHFHLVLGGIPRFIELKLSKKLGEVITMNNQNIEYIWKQLHKDNGFSHVRKYDPSLGAVGYVSKYLLKGGDVFMYAPPLVNREFRTPSFIELRGSTVQESYVSTNNQTDLSKAVIPLI